jgi:hypothetical protein
MRMKKQWIGVVQQSACRVWACGVVLWVVVQAAGAQPLATGMRDQKWGYFRPDGKTQIPFEFQEARSFSQRRAAVKKNYKWGFIKPNGEPITAFEYDQVLAFSEGLAAVCKSEKWGFIDTNGVVVVNLKYNWAQPFSEGLAPVQLDNLKWGCITPANKLVIPAQFDAFLHGFREGYAIAKIGYTYTAIDKSGKAVLPADLANAYPVSAGLLACKRGKAWGYLTLKGDTAIAFAYDWATPFQEGYAVVKKNGRYGVINSRGQIVVDFLYDDYRTGYREGLLPVKRGGLWGYIDTQGRTIIPFTYDERYGYPTAFSLGLAAVQVKGVWGYIDRTNQYQIEPSFYGGALPFVDVGQTNP